MLEPELETAYTVRLEETEDFTLPEHNVYVWDGTGESGCLYPVRSWLAFCGHWAAFCWGAEPGSHLRRRVVISTHPLNAVQEYYGCGTAGLQNNSPSEDVTRRPAHLVWRISLSSQARGFSGYAFQIQPSA